MTKTIFTIGGYKLYYYIIFILRPLYTPLKSLIFESLHFLTYYNSVIFLLLFFSDNIYNYT